MLERGDRLEINSNLFKIHRIFLSMTFQYGLNSLRQIGYQILQEISKMNQLRGLYHLRKPFLSGTEQRNLNDLEQEFGGIVDPLYNARNAFINWNAQCDLELNNYKRNQQLKNLERKESSIKNV